MAALFVLSAPSGAGKTTLKDMALQEFNQLVYSISVTTRPPRPGEINGQHYFFKSRDDFKKMISENQMLEYMEVHGNLYGTPRFYVEQVLNEGKSVVLDLDVYGKKHFDIRYPEAIGILILPPSFEDLEQRLINRGTDSEESIRIRMKNAREEVEFAQTRGKYEYALINNDLKETYQKFRGILLKHL